MWDFGYLERVEVRFTRIKKNGEQFKAHEPFEEKQKKIEVQKVLQWLLIQANGKKQGLVISRVLLL